MVTNYWWISKTAETKSSR